MIKKYILPVISVLLAILSVIFCVLWRTEANNYNELFRLTQSSVQNSYQCFKAYSTNGNESDYWSGVAEFRAFEQAYYMLTEDVDQNYMNCNSLYGLMISSPEIIQSNMGELVAALELLNKNPFDPNGYMKLSVLLNSFSQG